MSRIRSIHPGQPTDEAFVSCGAWARLLAIFIRNEADDHGIFEWKPLQLKMRIFPADPVNVAELLGELENTGQVAHYEVDGKRYGVIRNFQKYQRPRRPHYLHPLPSATQVPAPFMPPPDIVGNDDTPAEPAPDIGGNISAEEEKEVGKEEGEGERKQDARGARLPADWQPSAEDRLYAEGRLLDPDRIAEEFRDYWHARAGPNARKVDWSKTWKTWCRTTAERRGQQNGRRTHPGPNDILDGFGAALGYQRAADRESDHGAAGPILDA